MNLKQIIKIITDNGYKYSYNETLGDLEFTTDDEVISVYDTGNEQEIISEIKNKFSFLF